jgi:hypothetical protein
VKRLFSEKIFFIGAQRRLIDGVRAANPGKSLGEAHNQADVAKLVDALV